MSGIVMNTGKLKIYENLCALGRFAAMSTDFIDNLWQELLIDRPLYDEMCYYMQHRTFMDKVEYEGYTLCDLFIWQMGQDNLVHDTGKNTAECNKEAMVLKTFQMMIALKKNPQEWLPRLSYNAGMDQ